MPLTRTEFSKIHRPTVSSSRPSPSAPPPTLPGNNHSQRFWLLLGFISMFINNMPVLLLLDLPI